jgi:membrane protein
MSTVKQLVQRADAIQQARAWLAFPFAVGKKFGDDQAGRLAALIAYYAFFAIFPLLLVLVTVLDIVLKDHPALRQSLLDSALAQYPVIGPQLGHDIGPLNQTGLALVVGLIGTFIGARGVASAMQNGLNTVWEVPIVRRPGFGWGTLRSFALIVVVGLGLIGTTTLSVLAGGAGRVLTGANGTVAAWAVSLVLNFGVFWLAFRLGTARDVGWRQMWLGAAISAVIWQILQSVGGYFVSHQLAHASPTYGTFAIVIGLLGWLYLQAELTLFAVEINVVRALRLWPRSLAPPPYTEPDRRAYQLYAEATRRGEGLDIVVAGSGLGGEDHPQETSS